MADNYDQLALKWVREEVNKTLDQARQALEAFAENTDDRAQIDFCSNCLHQVSGTLTMLEFYGAALFSEEMEALATAIAENKTKIPARAQETLMGAILQLPTYLERVQAGQRDLPVLLLPLVNDLRGARGETLLSESSLFTPMLDGVEQPARARAHDAPASDADWREHAKKWRTHYQRGLLGIFRNQEVPDSLLRLLKVAEHMEQISAEFPAGLLWWVGAGFVEAIAENQIYKNASVHALLGALDKHLKQVGDEGAIALQHAPTPELLKNLLYYVACSPKRSERMAVLREAYALHEALPSAKQQDAERNVMTGSDATAIRTVLQALNEDLNGVKDGLDLFVRSRNKNPQDLLNLLPTLRQIADTLGMLGLNAPRDAVKQQVQVLQRLVDSGAAPNDGHVMDIAGSLLFVEANLSSVAQNAAQMASEETELETAHSAAQDEEVAAEAQFNQAFGSLLIECRNNLQKCKDSIIDFMASSWDHRLIESIPTQLTEVTGGMQIIGLPTAGDMVAVCQRFIAERVLGVGSVPDANQLDALADILTSVEYFLESLQEAGGQGMESVLTAAQPPTEMLRAELAKPLPEGALRARTMSADDSVTMIEPEPAAAPTMVPATTSSAPVSASAPVPAAVVISSAHRATDSDLIDQEVIEIFIEEAAEQLDAINENLPQWMADENNREALITMRRAFHTLKGSGRLVGATLLGEAAWAIEGLLNRVLDNTVAASPDVFALVREAAQDVIPDLRTAFAGQTEPTIRPESLIARAEALTRGESLASVADFSAGVSPVVVAAVPVVEATLSVETEQPVIEPVSESEAFAVADFTALDAQADVQFASPAPVETPEWMVESQPELVAEAEGWTLTSVTDSDLDTQVSAVAEVSGLMAEPEDGFALAVDFVAEPETPTEPAIAQGSAANAYAEFAFSEMTPEPLTGASNDEALTLPVADFSFAPIEETEAAPAFSNEYVADFSAEPFAAEAPSAADEFALPAADEADFGLETSLPEPVTEELTGALETPSDFAQWSVEEVELPDADGSDLAALTHPDTSMAEVADVDQDELVEPAAIPAAVEPTDPAVIEIFVGEALQHLDNIAQYLTDAALSPFSPKIADDVIRALHTLKGSARMAGLDPIAALMLPLEKHARDLQQRDMAVPAATLALLADSNTSLREVLSVLERSEPLAADALVDLVARAEVLEGSLADDAALSEAPTRDPEVLQMFLNQAMDLLSDADLTLRSWLLEPQDSLCAPQLADLMSMLNLSAQTAQVQTVATFAEDCTAFFARAEQVDANYFALAQRVLDAELDMLDRIAADQTPLLPEALQAELQAWMPAPLLEVELEEVATAEEYVEAAVAEEAIAEAAVVEAAVVEAAVVEAAVAEAAVAEEAVVEEAIAEEAIVEEAIAEEAVVEEAIAEEAIAEEAIAEEAIAEEAVVEAVEMAAVQTAVPSYQAETGHDYIAAVLPTNLAAYLPSDLPVAVTVDEDGEEILQIFMEEADEILLAIDEVFEGWANQPDDKATLGLLQRHLHTLKGGARLNDLTALGDLSHEFENLFEALNDGRMKPSLALVRVAQEGRDQLAAMVSDVREKRTLTKPSLYWQRLHQALAGQDPYADVVFAATTEAPAVPATPITKGLAPAAQASTPASVSANVVPFTPKERMPTAKPAEKQQTATVEFIRVPANHLEHLVNLAGEGAIFRGRLEQQVTVLKHNLQEMEMTVSRLREQLRNLEIETEAQVAHRKEAVGVKYDDFDPLEFDRYTRQQELSRALGESAGDLLNLKESLDNLASDAETLLIQQGRINSELHDNLIRARMVPFSSLVPRLKRMVRQIGDELGKGVELSIFAEGEMDRTVLERMVAPIEHMLRNAIDHGIERPEKRIANGKAGGGRIRIRLMREGSEVVVEIQDDGGGINTHAIRKKAIERGIINEQTKLTQHELMLMILDAGFSTAEQVTQISGRGVGMDVVASEIKTLGGRIDIDSELGKGSKFTVRLPFTVSVNQALMVRVGEDVYSVPLSNIEGIVRVSPYELQTYYDDESLRYDYAGQQYRMRYLGSLLDHNRKAQFEGVYKPVPILLLHGTDQPVALQVDDLLGSREVVVKTVGSLLSTISGLSGATILGDGRVVLILDVPALLRRMDAQVQIEREAAADVEKAPLVLVVDDSVTVRKVTGRLLERSGYRVETAKDGVDAVNVLHDTVPDIMLLDIEMPRMDGFELANIVRHDERLKNIPIIMITSRTGDKHRLRAEEIGVDRYLGKPFNDVELLNNIAQLLGREQGLEQGFEQGQRQ